MAGSSGRRRGRRCGGAAARLWLLALAVAAMARGAAAQRSWDAAGEEDAIGCDAKAIRRANTKHLHGLLSDLVNTTYFRLFRVQLDGRCPLDAEDEEPFKCKGSEDSPADLFGGGMSGMSPPPEKDPASCSVEATPVDRHLTLGEDKAVASAEEDCSDTALPQFWLDLCSRLPFKESQDSYINLQLNPETYTGYNGSSVWSEVYSENCFEVKEQDMCYEERFLYKLLSGMHASINLHISHQFYPPRKGKRDSWEPNVERFKEHFLKHEDRFRNLQFAFVVLLRAVRKATPFLESLTYKGVGMQETKRTANIMRMFLDAHVLSSCQGLFEAFDESLLFEDTENKLGSTMANLKQRFKGIFHNISNTMNCVKCQKCRLHGKLQLLGLGTAIKILLLPPDMMGKGALTREDVVALVNTAAKFSDAIEIYNDFQDRLADFEAATPGLSGAGGSDAAAGPSSSDAELIDMAMGVVARAASEQLLTNEQEDRLVDALLDGNAEAIILARHFLHRADGGTSFLRHSLRRVDSSSTLPAPSRQPDAVVIGAGLSGLTAAIALLDRGGSVVLIDKEAMQGGNSAKASSGINGIDERSERELDDSVGRFRDDVLRGSGSEGVEERRDLVDVLTAGSSDALEWLRSRVGLGLTEVGQLGGHSRPRTWRPAAGLAGSEIIAALGRTLRATTKDMPPERFTFHKKTRVTRIVEENGVLQGVECVDLPSNRTFFVAARNVIVATGGYGYHHGEDAFLNEVRPDLANFGTTNGQFATGDGIRMAMSVGGDTVDIDQVQVHPTAFVDPKDRRNPVKTLAAELLRGVGAVMLDPSGRRFVNELGTRKYVSETMLARQPGVDQPEFMMLLNEDSAAGAPKHIPMYMKKGLLQRYTTLEEVAAAASMEVQVLREALEALDRSAADPAGSPDPFNRTVFPAGSVARSPAYYVGWITPAVHYSMGGMRINADGQVLDVSRRPVLGGHLYAVGESTGGIHGQNRLGGNALTECTVFGLHVGKNLPLDKDRATSPGVAGKSGSGSSGAVAGAATSLPHVSADELASHGRRDDCWSSIGGVVYDFTDFVDDHPGEPEAIVRICGRDGTEEFEEVHSNSLLEEFDPIGKHASS